MKIITNSNKFDFPFEKYCRSILSVVPKNDLVGIKEIRFIDKFTHPKSDKESLAIYIQGNNGKNAIIEMHIPNITNHKIPEYYFEIHHEIAALLISEIIFHEIGHHVHHFKKHGIKKEKHEIYADNYAKAGYYQYLKLRRKKILPSYKWGSRNFLVFNKEQRKSFTDNYQDIINWMEKHKNGIPFP